MGLTVEHRVCYRTMHGLTPVRDGVGYAAYKQLDAEPKGQETPQN